jgi:hypothetical protein
MLKHITRNRLVGFWFAAVSVIIAVVAAVGVNVALSTTALLLTLSLLPPGIMLVLWRGAALPTAREILYAADTPKDGRR